MVTKSSRKAGKTKSNKGRIKTLGLKRETIKNLTGREQKKVKGGGGLAGTINGGTGRS